MIAVYIFLVDDDLHFLRFLERHARLWIQESRSKKGYRTRLFLMSEEAYKDAAELSQMERSASFILISNGDLPDQPGPDMVREFRNLLKERLHYVAICSRSDLQRRAAEEGGIPFFSKPVVGEEREALKQGLLLAFAE